MKFKSDKVKVWNGSWFGYQFGWLPNAARQQAFMDAMKNSIPLRGWDPHAKIWWIPDIYSHIAETIAVEHGVLRDDQLVDVRAFRGASYAKAEKDIPSALTELGLCKKPPPPWALVQRAMAYWENVLSAIPTASVELERKRMAFAVIEADNAKRGTLMEVLEEKP